MRRSGTQPILVGNLDHCHVILEGNVGTFALMVRCFNARGHSPARLPKSDAGQGDEGAGSVGSRCYPAHREVAEESGYCGRQARLLLVVTTTERKGQA
jgi:hypothetical protein